MDAQKGALLISGMNFCLRGALRAPLKQKFILLLSNALKGTSRAERLFAVQPREAGLN
jgi:hypothetical protein